MRPAWVKLEAAPESNAVPTLQEAGELPVLKTSLYMEAPDQLRATWELPGAAFKLTAAAVTVTVPSPRALPVTFDTSLRSEARANCRVVTGRSSGVESCGIFSTVALMTILQNGGLLAPPLRSAGPSFTVESGKNATSPVLGSGVPTVKRTPPQAVPGIPIGAEIWKTPGSAIAQTPNCPAAQDGVKKIPITSTVSEALLPLEAFWISMAPENDWPTFTGVGHVGPTAPPTPATAGIAAVTARNTKPRNAPQTRDVRRRIAASGLVRILPSSANCRTTSNARAGKVRWNARIRPIQAFPVAERVDSPWTNLSVGHVRDIFHLPRIGPIHERRHAQDRVPCEGTRLFNQQVADWQPRYPPLISG